MTLGVYLLKPPRQEGYFDFRETPKPGSGAGYVITSTQDAKIRIVGPLI
jgi:hypothetical protein